MIYNLDLRKTHLQLHNVRLFKLLSERNMCPIVLRLIIAMYILQMMQVSWGEIYQNNCASFLRL